MPVPHADSFAGTHPLDPAVRNGTAGPEGGGPITIGDDCWFGGNVTVLPNVTVGRGVTVGAGSVVTKVRSPSLSFAYELPSSQLLQTSLSDRSLSSPVVYPAVRRRSRQPRPYRPQDRVAMGRRALRRPPRGTMGDAIQEAVTNTRTYVDEIDTRNVSVESEMQPPL